ncbi:hypothetical protein H6G89_06385 [Oscillatoria sp. FACHB-1407]|uniref:hypothetical protein n=1 Tax=Oscillatoria sp. FACHB-1407 TaxID=2692847 RepID=UPI0016868FF1|nr:hypothetical protein [Oscillatoria sp. FACHB-1407]MBD2460668.1 hypothetical protein [Oscillatoria sp. FACHB-1407]
MNNDDLDFGEDLELIVHPRESETVALQIPKDTLESLKKVAEQREMPLEALLKFYIGKCLRQDLSQLFASQVMDSTAKVLARYHHSEEEVSKILQEIRLEAK